MKAFLWTLIVLWGISTACKVIFLANYHGEREVPRGADVFDAIANVGFMFWAFSLLP